MEKIILIGAGGHAKTIIDTLEQQGRYEIAGFVDRERTELEIYHSYKVIGCDSDLKTLYQKGIHTAVVCIGFMGKSKVRNRLYCELKKIGFMLPVITDSSAVVACDAKIGEGTYIGRNAVVNADAKIGKMCIINTAAIIEHECEVGDFTHIAVGAVLCGQAAVGENTMIGANATIIQGVSVEKECIVGASSLVLKDVPCNSKVIGIPARIIEQME